MMNSIHTIIHFFRAIIDVISGSGVGPGRGGGGGGGSLARGGGGVLLFTTGLNIK